METHKLTAKEYYKSTRYVPTNQWTLDMTLAFADEYHASQFTPTQAVVPSKESDNKFEEWLENKRAACNTGQFIHIYDVIIDNYRRLSAKEGEEGK